jgi:hypothetical protein
MTLALAFNLGSSLGVCVYRHLCVFAYLLVCLDTGCGDNETVVLIVPGGRKAVVMDLVSGRDEHR